VTVYPVWFNRYVMYFNSNFDGYNLKDDVVS